MPGGAVLEIFEFQPQQPLVQGPWNRVGLTHFSLNVRNTQKWHDYLVSKGVEIVSKPERSPRGHTFFFAKDCDGNLIEIDGSRLHALRAATGSARSADSCSGGECTSSITSRRSNECQMNQ